MNKMPRKLVALCAFLAVATPVFAQDATSALYSCADKTDTTERLACYDEAVAALRSAETSGNVIAITTDEIADVEVETFGQADERVDGRAAEVKAVVKAETDEVSAGIVSIDEAFDGKLLVTLDNGQVWRQTDSRRVSVSRRSPPETATVKKAALGSFRMKLGNSRAFRATRVQ